MASRDFAGAVARRRSSRSLMAHSLRLGHALQSVAVNPEGDAEISRHAWRRVRSGVDRYLLLAAMTSIRGRSNHLSNRKSRTVIIQSVRLPKARGRASATGHLRVVGTGRRGCRVTEGSEEIRKRKVAGCLFGHSRHTPPVSYTHLDVYKRQAMARRPRGRPGSMRRLL